MLLHCTRCTLFTYAQPVRYLWNEKPKTGILLLNMGGPQSKNDVYSFLTRLFSDKEIFRLPFQKTLSKLIAKRRSPMIERQYSVIGGGSPITFWTQVQGRRMVEYLDKTSPTTAPHKFYVGFRYVHPLLESSINEMERDGVERAIAFSQYPQYSCTTSGSSLNAVVQHYQSNSKTFTGVEYVDPPKLRNGIPGPVWSFIDRWPVFPALVSAFAELIVKELHKVEDPNERQQTVLLFSAHSIPMYVVNRGDPYPQEVAATVHAVMQLLNFKWPYRLVWQSKVGPVSWLGPTTKSALHGLARLGYRHAILVPIAFTSDHIETLYEMDVEYCSMVAKKSGMVSVRRTPALNDNVIFTTGLGELVVQHLRSSQPCTTQFLLRCPLCTNPSCARTRDFILAQDEKLKQWTDVVSPSTL